MSTCWHDPTPSQVSGLWPQHFWQKPKWKISEPYTCILFNSDTSACQNWSSLYYNHFVDIFCTVSYPCTRILNPWFCTWSTYTYTPYIHLAVLLLLLCNYLHHTIAILMYSVCNFFTLFSPWRKKCRETLDIRMWKRWLIQVTHRRC